MHSKMHPLQVDAYEQGRPGYPLEAVQYALKELHLNEGHRKVLDLAAGTGKLTRYAPLVHFPASGVTVQGSSVHECLQCLVLVIVLHIDQLSAIVLALTNKHIRRMLAQQSNLEVVAVEPNEAMVGKFKALQPNIEIHQAAAQDLPFEDNSIDAVCAAQVKYLLHICCCTTRKLHVNPDLDFAI